MKLLHLVKGQAELVNTIGILAIAAAMVFLFFMILPKVIDFMFEQVALASSSIVAKQLADLITISAAAPYGIEIYYLPSELKYNVDIKDRFVWVKIVKEKERVPVEEIVARESIAIDPVASFSKTNSFTIYKAMQEKGFIYQVEAK